jgi:hypothetical protein
VSPHVGGYLAISIANKPTIIIKKFKKKEKCNPEAKKEMKE